MGQATVSVRILRSTAADTQTRIDSFTVPHVEAMTGLSMLRYIHENLDPTLAFRDYRCGRGVCNTCWVKINGKIERMCEVPVQPGDDLLLEPASPRVIKDLVIDLY